MKEVATPRNTFTARCGAHRGEAGFTLMETLIALVVFAISVVGLVAMESRSLEAQRASNEMRQAERVAQEAMAELMSRGVPEFVAFDFEGNATPDFPYNDTGLPAAARKRSMRRPPADLASTVRIPGALDGTYLVVREVNKLPDDGVQPAGDASLVQALVFEVTVLYLDNSNPSLPVPATETVGGLTLDNIDPTDTVNFKPFVGHVELRTVRMNDTPDMP